MTSEAAKEGIILPFPEIGVCFIVCLFGTAVL